MALGGHLYKIQLVLVVPCQYLLHWQDRVEQGTVPLASVFQRDGSAFRADEALLLQRPHIFTHRVTAHARGFADGAVS